MKTRIIKWRDSEMYTTQMKKDNDFNLSIVTSVGFVISENKERIVLAGDLIDEDVRRVIVIPKECIL